MGYRVSKKASAELDAIVIYTAERWGVRQAGKYLGEMESMFELLAGNPGMGRAAQSMGKTTRRIEQGSHVIFYRPTGQGIFVQRILHKTMLPRR
jgi:toxin ParE1/3/4